MICTQLCKLRRKLSLLTVTRSFTDYQSPVSDQPFWFNLRRCSCNPRRRSPSVSMHLWVETTRIRDAAGSGAHVFPGTLSCLVVTQSQEKRSFGLHAHRGRRHLSSGPRNTQREVCSN